MIISISDAVTQSWLVIIFIVITTLATLRKSATGFFPRSTTDELKGLAILLVVFSHIGYFLVNDHQFLVPLSNYAGVGVDLFLLLSGFGLCLSALRRSVSRRQFYAKRFFRLYLPVVMIVGIFLALDAVILRHMYPASIVLKNILGFFPSADLYSDINSPLWFVTLLLAFYFVFPLVFFRRFPLLSAAILGVASWWLGRFDLHEFLPITAGVASFYRLHLYAFPMGMALASIVYEVPRLSKRWTNSVQAFVARSTLWPYFRSGACILLSVGCIYALQHSAVGQGWKQEELTSVVSALLVMGVFVTCPLESRFLSTIGAYSFEIYLIHWPLLYRYNMLFGHMPAGVATVLSLALFLALGYVFQKGVGILVGGNKQKTPSDTSS